jgi:hypothetical protein
VDLVYYFEKNQKLHIWIVAVTLKVTSCRTMRKRKRKSEKSEKARFYEQNKLHFKHLALQPLGSSSHMAAYRSPSKNTRKMKLIPILNKTLPQAHMELEFDMLGVPRKLVKDVVHLSK